MSSIDERIVEMKFLNREFEKGIKESTESLKDFDKALDIKGSGDALGKVAEAADKVDLSNLESSIDKVSSKFNVFGAIGFTVIQNLVNAAIGWGENIAGAVLDPLVEGGKKRALAIEQAKFQFKGLGLDVEKTMDAARTAVLGTAFGLDEAATAAANLSASQVPIGQLTGVLRGIAGVAAMSGSSFGDVADVFQKVAGQGRLMGDDLNRLASRGINAAATLGSAMGKTEAEVREMVTKGKISFEMFSNAMNDAFGEHATKASETYTGALSNMRAAFSRIGAEFATVNFERQRRIFNALTPVIDQVNKALEPMYELYRDISYASADFIAGMLGKVDLSQLAEAMVPFTNGLRNLWKAWQSITDPIARAWEAVFPPSQGGVLLGLASAFETFTSKLILSEGAAQGVETVFTTIFRALKFGGDTVGTVLSFIGESVSKLFGLLGGLGGVFGTVLKWFGKLASGGDKTQEALSGFFGFLGKVRDSVIDPVIESLKNFAGILDGTFNGSVGGYGENLKKAFAPLGEIGANIGQSFKGVGGLLKSVWDAIEPIVSAIGNVLSGVGTAILGAFENLDWDKALKLINSGVVVYVFHTLKQMFSGGNGLLDSISGTFDALTGALSGLQEETKPVKLLQIAAAVALLAGALLMLTQVNPDNMGPAIAGLAAISGALVGMTFALLKITNGKDLAQMGRLATSLILLSLALNIMAGVIKKMSGLSWDELGRGLAGAAGGIALLIVPLFALQKINGTKMNAAALALNGVAFSLITFGAALKIMSTLSWDDLGRGLVAVAGGMVVMVGALMLLSLVMQNPKGMLAIGVAAGALLLVATSVLILSAAMLVVAGAVNLMVFAVERLGNMDSDVVSSGLENIGNSLAVLALGLTAMVFALPGAAALVVATIALLAFAGVLQVMSLLDPEATAQGLTIIAKSLLVLAVGLTAMAFAIPGAIALTVAALGLTVLAGALGLFSLMDPEAAAKGLLLVGVALGVLAVAGVALGPAIPGLLGMAIALGVVAVAAVAIGAALVVAALGLTMISAAGAGAALAIRVLGDALGHVAQYNGDIAILGASLLAFGLGLAVAAVGVVLMGAALLALGAGLGLIGLFAAPAAAGLTILATAAEAQRDKISAILEMSVALGAFAIVAGPAGFAALALGAGLMVLSAALSVMSAVGVSGAKATVKAIETLLTVLSPQNLVGLPVLTTNLMTLSAAMAALAFAALPLGPAMMLAGTALALFAAVGPVASSAMMVLSVAVGALAPRVGQIMTFATAVGMMSGSFGRAAAGGVALAAALALIGAGANAASSSTTKAVTGMSSGFPKVAQAAKTASTQVKTSMVSMAAGVASAAPTVVRAIASMAASVSAAVRNMAGSVRSAGATVGHAISAGMSSGIYSGRSQVSAAARSVANAAMAAARSTLGVASPSKEFTKIGKFVDEGLVSGMRDGIGQVKMAATALGQAAIDSASDVLEIHSPSKAFQRLGEYSAKGFYKGLLGIPDDVKTVARQAIDQMKQELATAQQEIGPALKEAQKKANDLNLAHRPIANNLYGANQELAAAKRQGRSTTKLQEKVKKLQKQYDESIKKNRAASAAYKELHAEQTKVTNATKVLKEMEKVQGKQLDDLTKKHDKLTQKIEDANKAYEDAIKTRDDYNKAIRDQYSDLGDLGGEQGLSQYMDDLQTQIEKTLEFGSKLQKLRDQGLSDALYEEFLKKGIDSLPFIDEVIEAGGDGINNLNRLADELDQASTELGRAASRELYQAGVDMAKGLLEGLKKEEKELKKQMESLANAMVTAVKKALGIKSPSKELAKVGVWANKGLIKGLESSASSVNDAAEQVAEDALETLRKSLVDISALAMDGVDWQPVIRPVLDLSGVREGAGALNSLFDAGVSASSGYTLASSVAGSMSGDSVVDTPVVLPGSTTFIQNNYSPKSLSSADIYRQSKNLLSIKKGELPTNAKPGGSS